MTAIVEYLQNERGLSTNVAMTQVIARSRIQQFHILDTQYADEITQLREDIKELNEPVNSDDIVALLYLTDASQEFITEIIKLIVYCRELAYISYQDRIKKILPPPSEEQKRIVELSRDYNVVCDSVAGSGKTTTICHILRTLPIESRALILTYNKRLQLETAARLSALREFETFGSVENCTYHGFASKYYKHAHTDTQLKAALKVGPRFAFHFDLIIIDEAQDIQPITYELVCKIIRDMNFKPKICILGDKHQSIYDYMYADARFIIFAQQLFNFNNDPYRSSKLSISYRLTSQMSRFVNECVLKQPRIQSVSTGAPVDYYICHVFKPIQIANIIRNSGYQPTDIFILAKSIRSSDRSPVAQLANVLSSNYHMPIYKPGDDDEKLDPDVIKHKLVFASFHQVKGLERKLVVIMSFDSSYYYNREADDIAPNAIYVAVTRAKEKLILLHHYQNNYLPFLAYEKLPLCVNVINTYQMKPQDNAAPPGVKTVSQLLRHMPDVTLETAREYLIYRNVTPKGATIKIETKTKQIFSNIDIAESVADINGYAIPAYHEYKNTGKMTIYQRLKDARPLRDITSARLLEIATAYIGYAEKCHVRENQIENYDWLPQNILDKCAARLAHISKNAKYEIVLEKEISGVADCVDNDTMYEFKCVSELVTTHYLQLAIYAYLDNFKHNYKLMNILTNETHELVVDKENITTMVAYLIDEKQKRPNDITDENFINAVNAIRDKYR